MKKRAAANRADAAAWHAEDVAATLRARLQWPADPQYQAAWRSQWSSSFRHRPGHVITTANGWPRRWPAWRGALMALHLVEFALDDEAGSLAALPAAGALHRRRPRGGQVPGAGQGVGGRPRRHQRQQRLRGHARGGVEFLHRQLPGLSQVAEGPQGAGAVRRGRAALRQNRHCAARDDAHHGGKSTR